MHLLVTPTRLVLADVGEKGLSLAFYKEGSSFELRLPEHSERLSGPVSARLNAYIGAFLEDTNGNPTRVPIVNTLAGLINDLAEELRLRFPDEEDIQKYDAPALKKLADALQYFTIRREREEEMCADFIDESVMETVHKLRIEFLGGGRSRLLRMRPTR